MNPDDPLLAAIAAEPHDVAARLVYADWLEERGDPLAELVRLELQRDTLSPLDPAYGLLKDHLKQVRSLVPEHRRSPLGYGDGYRPLFQRLPQERIERWRLVDRFLEAWCGSGLDSSTGVSRQAILDAEERLGIRLPQAVREFYQLVGNVQLGRSLKHWSNQDKWLSLENLEVESGFLRFRWENQHCCCWKVSVEDNSEDPPVWIDRGNQLDECDSSEFSRFALFCLVHETLMAGLYESDLLEYVDELRSTLQACDLGTSYWCIRGQIFEGEDVLCMIQHVWVQLLCRSEAARSRLSPALRAELEANETSRP